jgi:hypothetical protein
VIFVQVLPPLVLTCHCTVGVVASVAAAVKVTCVPAVTVWLVGLVVTTGGVLMVNVAADVVVVPSTLVNAARYWLPVIAAVAVKV